MKHRKTAYTKRATTYREQIDILRGYGVAISDEVKAQEYLGDIGYYRLGFYLYPFEITYPCLDYRRRHEVKTNTRIEDVVALYYFDFDLRNILNRYISRIEVAIRTSMVYELSNKYADDSTWYVSSRVVDERFIDEFASNAYNSIKNRVPIKRHHCKYIGPYAPAWKTMEFMTLGNLEALYRSLKRDEDKKMISSHFHEPAISTFQSYMRALREVRNACAHGNVLFDLKLTSGVRTGAACPRFKDNDHQTFKGALCVIDYLLREVSANRATDMWKELRQAARTLYLKTPRLQALIELKTGICVKDV